MSPETAPTRRRYVPAVGPRLRVLLQLVLALFAVLGVNAAYLGAITFLEWWTGNTYQNYVYQLMFLGHLVLGVVLLVVLPVFGVLHIRAAASRPNRRAVGVGYALFGVGMLLLISGVVLTRIEGFEIKDPGVRSVSYWTHVVTPFLVAWLFVLHRLAGPKIRWRIGLRWSVVAMLVTLPMVVFHSQDPKQWDVAGPADGEQYFFPSLARTATGGFIPAESLSNDAYCRECHPDVHDRWQESVHRFSSFNNPAYLFSVRETRAVAMERDGSIQASRFCAGCHDPVPFFSGAFDDPDFDDVNHPTADDGITCTGCHAITNINSVRGNADFTIEEPSHYPFAFSDQPVLAWINRQLVRAKPAFHKKTFLKPLHQSAEFCGACHKVHLPVELNDYKWLRGQNHYDSWRLSGVSGHGVQSWYYPDEAQRDCNGCHMPTRVSDDFGAQDFDDDGFREVHDHLFPSANTAIPTMLGRPEWVVEEHRKFTEGSLRVDLFGLREGGTIDGQLHAPLRPQVPALVPGERYLLDAVVRTLTLGHVFPQGTSDSNEIWLDVTVRDAGAVVGRSGGRASDGGVDPWSHFANSYVIDREGRRIDRRNAQDIFVALYNHQIPPGAADVVHYAFTVPPEARGPITVEVALQYRKFDTIYMRYIEGDDFERNELPILTIATDSITFPVVGGPPADAGPVPEIPEWQRWNDYGIGLFRKGDEGANRGELRQASEAFAEVELLGRPDGPLNLARVYLKEGRVDEAAEALNRAAAHEPPAPPWSIAWFTGLVNEQNGYLDEAIESFREVLEMDTAETRERGFDFSHDDVLLTSLGQALYERSKLERGERALAERERLLGEALDVYRRALELDPENVAAHYGLSLVHEDLGEPEIAEAHRRLHGTYKPDDNARDSAVAAARRADPAANRAAEAVVLYDLQREGAFQLPDDAWRPTADTEGSR